MNRRKFIATAIKTLAASSSLVATRISAWPFNNHFLQTSNNNKTLSGSESLDYFSQHQFNLVKKLASLIIPSDETPGANEANVAQFIDQLVLSSKKKQKIYTKGLKKLDEYCKKEYELDFLKLNEKQQHLLLADIFNIHERRSTKPDSLFSRINLKALNIWDNAFGSGKLVEFFASIRFDTMQGFYSHPVGWDNIGYYGPPQPLGYPDFGKAPKTDSKSRTAEPQYAQQNVLNTGGGRSRNG